MDTSPIARLSPELRNILYKEVLRDTVIDINNTSVARNSEPTISRTCRQLRTETLGLFYMSAHFVARIGIDKDILSGEPVHNLDRISYWLKKLGATKVAAITHLELWFPESLPIASCLVMQNTAFVGDLESVVQKAGVAKLAVEMTTKSEPEKDKKATAGLEDALKEEFHLLQALTRKEVLELDLRLVYGRDFEDNKKATEAHKAQLKVDRAKLRSA